CLFFCFFFQAEDGIRDRNVTGVQTCALPISGIMMSFARAIGEFGATLMVAGYIPNKTNTLPLEIYFLVEQGKENQAWLWVLVLVAFAVTVIGTINVLNKDDYREVR